ncbi:hypothetical protein WDU94_004773 [Cyamophila willieti]
MLDILQILPVPAGDPESGESIDLATVQVISVASLTSFLQNRSELIDNAPLLCPHQKLNPSLVKSCKYVTAKGAAKLYEHLSGGPPMLLGDSMCRDCVYARCKSLRVQKKTGEDAKEIQSLLKLKLDVSKPTFWVGKNSLKYWKSLVNKDLAIKNIMNRNESPTSSSESKNNIHHSRSGLLSSQTNGDRNIINSSKSESDKINSCKNEPLDKSDQISQVHESNLSKIRLNNVPTANTGGSKVLEPNEPDCLNNKISLRKRVIDDRPVEDERSKRIRIGGTRNSEISESIHEDSTNSHNISLRRNYNKSKSIPSPLENIDGGKTVNNTKHMKPSVIPSQEMSECFVLIEKLESTMNLLKSKLYKVCKDQQTQYEQEDNNLVDLLPNEGKKMNGELDSYDSDSVQLDHADPSVDSEHILNSKIEFNTYNVKSETPNDSSFKRNNHILKLKIEPTKSEQDSQKRRSDQNIIISENRRSKRKRINDETSDNDTSSPTNQNNESYSNSIDRVLENNKRGNVKSPELRQCYTEEGNENRWNSEAKYEETNNSMNSSGMNKEVEIVHEESRSKRQQDQVVNGDGEAKKRRQREGRDNEGDEDEESTDENGQKEFNEDILCPHGKCFVDISDI